MIDYGSPNIAKGMHVGHLRSTLIGAALVHIHKNKGHTVTGDNHIGDFGTPLGIVISQIKNNPAIVLTLQNIESLYVQGSILYKDKNNIEFKEQVNKITNLLQTNDPEIKSIWNSIVAITKADLHEDYKSMGINFDEWNGESVFEPLIPPMIAELKSKKLVSDSNGAVVMELDGMQPLMLEKSGGGYLYHTTDLACVKSRQHYDLMLYVVDKRQSLHFQQVFTASKIAGYLSHGQAEHIAFGTINGIDGKPFKTRSGEVLKLKQLIYDVCTATELKLNPSLSQKEKESILPVIAMGALKFAELKTSRTSDYVFDLNSFVSLEGCTGPYVMYSGVRAKSILAKNENSYKVSNEIYSEVERTLWISLNSFNSVFELALNKNKPHHLALYSYELASKFNNFYSAINISKESDLVKKQHYLFLVNHFVIILTKTLDSLGISLPEKM